MKSYEKNYFQPNELENLLKQLTEKAELQKLTLESDKLSINPSPLETETITAYTVFINECRSKQYQDGTVLEKHHIVPKHIGGTDAESNLVSLSIQDHIIAHWLLWKINNSENDKRAYIFRVSSKEERIQLQKEFIQQNIEKYKAFGLYFYNSEYQREQGVKGGQKGGRANTKAQFQARQKVGKTYGPVVGKSNQKDNLVSFLAKYTIWEFSGCKSNASGEDLYFSKKRAKTCPENTTEELFYLVLSPKDTFVKLLSTLELFAPGCFGNSKRESLYQVVNNYNKKSFGWKVCNTLTRSEVEAGALVEFINSVGDVPVFLDDSLPE